MVDNRNEKTANEAAIDELAESLVIGPVVKQFVEVMRINNLTFREATLLFTEARRRMWPSLEGSHNKAPVLEETAVGAAESDAIREIVNVIMKYRLSVDEADRVFLEANRHSKTHWWFT
jgi:hypothetical protein